MWVRLPCTILHFQSKIWSKCFAVEETTTPSAQCNDSMQHMQLVCSVSVVAIQLAI